MGLANRRAPFVAFYLERNRDLDLTTANPNLRGELIDIGRQLVGVAERMGGPTLPPPAVHPSLLAGASERRTTSLVTPEQDRAWREYLTSGHMGPEERRILQVAVDEQGGFTVPPDVKREVIARAAATAVIRRHATIQPTSGTEALWPRVQPHPSSPSVYTSGFVGDWSAETSLATETEPKWGHLVIPVRDLTAHCRLSRNLIADAAFDVVAYIAKDGGTNLGLVEDKGFLTGTGNLQPAGILNDTGIATVDVEGTTANTISNTTSALGSATKLIDLVAALPSQYHANACWVMHRLTAAKIRKLTDAQGRFLWAAGLETQPPTLLGYPVELTDFMPQDGTDGNKCLLFGDLGVGYVIGDRERLSVQVLVERYADDNLIGLILRERAGGNVANPDAFRIGVV
jgi:HK97 family phage major capsid protein